MYILLELVINCVAFKLLQSVFQTFILSTRMYVMNFTNPRSQGTEASIKYIGISIYTYIYLLVKSIFLRDIYILLRLSVTIYGLL